MSGYEELRSCPKCGSADFAFMEIVDNVDGTELHDIIECDECGCRYRLIFEYAKKEEV